MTNVTLLRERNPSLSRVCQLDQATTMKETWSRLHHAHMEKIQSSESSRNPIKLKTIQQSRVFVPRDITRHQERLQSMKQWKHQDGGK